MPSIKVRGLPPPQDHGHTTGGDGGSLGTGVVDTTQLADEAVNNAKVKAAAGIAKTKLAALEIVNADVNAAAEIAKSKLAALEIADADVAAAAAIAQGKLDLAITDTEVAVGADISKDKLAALARAGMYHGDEVEVSVVGTTEEQVKDLAIIIDPTNALDLKTLRVIARLKSTNASTASLKIYHDGGGTPDLTLTSISATYEEKAGTIDVSGWGTGRHTVEIKLVDDTAAETAYNELLEIYGVQ